MALVKQPVQWLMVSLQYRQVVPDKYMCSGHELQVPEALQVRHELSHRTQSELDR